MDYQVLFNGAIMLASFFGGWTLNTITKSLERLDQDVRSMPSSYVAKDDYRTDIRDVREMLSKIFDKIDGKVDK
jgi:hypothetical protein